MLFDLYPPIIKERIRTELVMTESLSLERANPLAVSVLRCQNSVVKTDKIRKARFRTINANARFFKSVRSLLWNHLHKAKNRAKNMILMIFLSRRLSWFLQTFMSGFFEWIAFHSQSENPFVEWHGWFLFWNSSRSSAGEITVMQTHRLRDPLSLCRHYKLYRMLYEPALFLYLRLVVAANMPIMMMVIMLVIRRSAFALFGWLFA